MNNKRVLLLVILIFAFFCTLAVHLFNIQIRNHADYEYYARNQQLEKRVIRAERGFLYDRNGELLAYDRNDVSFYVDTKMIKAKNIDSLAKKFEKVFGNSRSYYKNLIRKSSSRIVCIMKKAPAEKAELLKEYRVEGLTSVSDPTRIYSYDNAACHILGYVNNNYTGTEGIEKYYDKLLTGTNGRMVIERDVRGRMITVAEESTVYPVPGNSLTLTIDLNYQRILEEELRKGLEVFQSNNALGIVMDPNTGEILAMSNMPDYNLNSFNQAPAENRRNRALTDPIEPGSTFKTLTLSTLVDQKLCRLDESVYAENGLYRYKKARITDSHRHQTLTVREVLEQSSNIGMAKLIGRISEESFYKYLRNYGFGNVTSIDLPGETKGTLKKPGNFNELTQAFMSFGYEVAVTPIQLITAYAALINGGNLYQPHLLKRVSARSGEVIEENEPKMLRNVISEKTSAKMRELLLGVVENGTGDKAKIENVSVGGKTGTSQQLVNNKYSSSSHNSSFIGFFPVDKPKVLIYILASAPKVGQYGGVVAGPIFKNVAERILKADINLLEQVKSNGTNKSKDAFDHVFASASKENRHANSYANVSSKPAVLNRSSRIIVNKNFMPDLSNTNLRDAVSAMTELGIKCRVSGSGRVVSQSIAPGERIKPGLVCVIKCEEKKISGAKIN